MIKKTSRLKQMLYVFFIIPLMCYSTVSSASLQILGAQVLDYQGLPCFTVEAGKNAELLNILVEERSADMQESLDDLWDQAGPIYDQKPVMLDFPACLLYGTELENKNGLYKARKLNMGKIYRVALYAAVMGPTGRKHGQDYVGYFCLARTANGTKVHQLFYDKDKEELNVEVCKPLNPTVPPPLPVYHAKIFDRQGVPCFTVNNNDKRRAQFRSIYVHNNTSANAIVWEMRPSPIGPNQNILLGPRKCLPYAAHIQDARSPPHESLEPNQLYRVELKLALDNSSRPGNDFSTIGVEERDYKGYFCLSRTKNGKTKVHEVPYNEKKQKWNFDVCKFKNETSENSDD